MSFIERLTYIEETYKGLESKMLDPEISQRPQEMMRIHKELKAMERAYRLYLQLKQTIADKADAKATLENETDTEMLDLAREQLSDATTRQEDLEAEIKIALLPTDPNDDKNIFLEVRPAAWGDEAWLFAEELLRMYMRYAERQALRTEIVEHDLSDIGGLKLWILKISWDSVFSKLKFESGVHRVQRIPDTESNGRIHTSTVTVAVMPEIEDVDITINPNDVTMDTYAASSAGGQNANKNQTWVRLHHLPTGLIVTIGDSKSQLQNKEKARAVLRSRLYQIEQDKQQAEQKEKRLDQVGTWDRSEKIRTYNFPQDRVTDHRIKESRGNLPGIMDGDIQDIIDKLIVENQQRLLAAQTQAWA
jgi:peptide chain release factor 1